MAINKVVYGDQTLIDLTGDTVEASNLLEGETAHTRSGSPVTGTAKQGHIVKDVDGTAMTQRPAIKFADADVSDDSTNQQTVVEVMHDPMTLANFLDAQNLDDGIYPVTEDDNTVLSSDMISHGNGTVEQALNNKADKSSLSWTFIRDISGNTQSNIETEVDTYNELLIQIRFTDDNKLKSLTTIIPTNGLVLTIVGSAQSNSMGLDLYSEINFNDDVSVGWIMQVPFIVKNGTYIDSGYIVKLFAR